VRTVAGLHDRVSVGAGEQGLAGVHAEAALVGIAGMAVGAAFFQNLHGGVEVRALATRGERETEEGEEAWQH
jgi:hypothetical protein